MCLSLTLSSKVTLDIALCFILYHFDYSYVRKDVPNISSIYCIFRFQIYNRLVERSKKKKHEPGTNSNKTFIDFFCIKVYQRKHPAEYTFLFFCKNKS